MTGISIATGGALPSQPARGVPFAARVWRGRDTALAALALAGLGVYVARRYLGCCRGRATATPRWSFVPPARPRIRDTRRS